MYKKLTQGVKQRDNKSIAVCRTVSRTWKSLNSWLTGRTLGNERIPLEYFRVTVQYLDAEGFCIFELPFLTFESLKQTLRNIWK